MALLVAVLVNRWFLVMGVLVDLITIVPRIKFVILAVMRTMGFVSLPVVKIVVEMLAELMEAVVLPVKDAMQLLGPANVLAVRRHQVVRPPHAQAPQA